MLDRRRWPNWARRFSYGSLADRIGASFRSSSRGRHAILLSARQFERAVTCERIRSTRRSIPFCIVTITHLGDDLETRQIRRDRSGSKLPRYRSSRRLVGLLHRNLRVTDEKAFLSGNRYGVLLVDTPEMGGRAVLDRLQRLLITEGINAKMHMEVHDPEGFGDDHGDDDTGSSSRRHDDPATERWVRPPESAVAANKSSLPNVISESHLTSSLTPSWVMWLKRAIDVTGASVGLIVTGPAMLFAMALIRLSDGGPVLFCQTREGRHGRPFTIYKLRTMCVNAEQMQGSLQSRSHRDGPAFKIACDPRVTRVGRWLRATCIDELPQLLNILRGDMSLVGPRPLPWHESRACDRWHRRRLDVRPGLTCIWQINKSKAETFDDWMRMDLRYVDRIGVMRDLQLIAQTVVVSATGRGGE